MLLTPRSSPACPHGHRGTAICLYCRQDARDAARRRRNRVLARLGISGLGGGVVIALIVGGLVALAPDASSNSAGRDTAVAAVPAAGASSRAAATASRAPSIHMPQTPHGRKELGDGVVAERAGDEVTVHFDTDSLRTRFDWKFEGVVRGTLPLVFGEPARIALDSVPHGALVRGANLLNQLPRRGIALPLGELGTLTVWPIVRPGRDGPVVVAYRALVTR